MGKYDPLEDYLKKQPLSTTQLVLTFAQIEKIISDDLPPSSQYLFRWWDNKQTTRHSDTWLNAGFQTVMVDMENKKVKLKRI